MNRLRFLASFCYAASLTSCGWLGPLMGHHSTQKDGSGVLLVQVSPWFGERVPVYGLAHSRKDGKRGPLLAKQRAPADGAVNFVVPMGRRYDVLAFADTNRNGRRDGHEPAAIAENLEALSPFGSGPQYGPVQLRLPGQGVTRKPPQPRGRLTPTDRSPLDELRRRLPTGLHSALGSGE